MRREADHPPPFSLSSESSRHFSVLAVQLDALARLAHLSALAAGARFALVADILPTRRLVTAEHSRAQRSTWPAQNLGPCSTITHGGLWPTTPSTGFLNLVSAVRSSPGAPRLSCSGRSLGKRSVPSSPRSAEQRDGVAADLGGEHVAEVGKEGAALQAAGDRGREQPRDGALALLGLAA